MNCLTVGDWLPNAIVVPLFDDRAKFGLLVKPADPCRLERETTHFDSYCAPQERSLGNVANNSGYRVLNHLDLKGKQAPEFEPSDINYIDDGRGTSAHFVIADVQQAMLDVSNRKLSVCGIPSRMPVDSGRRPRMIAQWLQQTYELRWSLPGRYIINVFRLTTRNCVSLPVDLKANRTRCCCAARPRRG